MSVEKRAKGMRKTIAANMVNSWHTSPKCDFEMKINAEPMMAFRKAYNEKNGTKISYLNLVMKAVAIALKEFPYMNSSYDFERHVHLLHENINVGIVISIPNGLMVANVRNASELDLDSLNGATAALIERVKIGAITLDDITGSTFTINNMGAYKRLIHHNAIINQPEVGILSMYNIVEEPVVKDGAVIIQKNMNLMLSTDHRVIDGDVSCAFLDRICDLLEDPEKLAE